MLRYNNLWAIIGQKISYNLAKQLRQRSQFYSVYGLNCKPSDINTNDLINIGLSNIQILIINRVNNYLISNNIELNAENLESLKCIKGIGDWTIKTTMLTAFLSWDVIPNGDYFIKKRLQKLYNLSKLPTNKEVENISIKWSPFRSFVAWYIWRYDI